MKRVILIAVALATLVTSCNNAGGEKPVAETHAKPVINSDLDAATTTDLVFLVNRYYELKDALVSTNDTGTYKTAVVLASATDSFKMLIMKDSVKAIAMLPLLDSIIAHSRAIANISDPTCEKQRVEFSPLSEAIFQLLKKANVQHAGIYREYCPMALNDAGAYWLSKEEEIKNPYFGKKMLECGEVKDSL